MSCAFWAALVLAGNPKLPIQAPDAEPPAVQSMLIRTFRIGSKQLDFQVTPDQVRKTPPWRRDAENPPLSARTAIKQAADALETLSKQIPLDKEVYGDADWGFRSLELKPLDSADRWAWIVHYELTSLMASKPRLHLEIAVLMNGQVIVPAVKNAP